MAFELTSDIIENIEKRVEAGEVVAVVAELHELHAADVAEILEALDRDVAITLINHIDDELAADALVEVDEDIRAKLLKDVEPKVLAETVVENLDSDDAADIIGDLPEEKKRAVLNNLEDSELAKQIASLLTHADDTAGSLMATELVKVNENWSVMNCVRQMRRQAEEVDQVYAVYVVDDSDILLGSLSLKKLLTTSTRTPIKEIYDSKIRSVVTTTDAEEVAQIMQKYDLFSMPVTDDMGRLLGRITLDDIVDVITEEAERDYSLASGLTDEVDDTDSLFTVTKIRLPWLIVGLLGGLVTALVIGKNEERISVLPQLAFFMPLIAAMGGNVGVQSSAIVVRALANNSFGKDNLSRLAKEFSVGLVNGIICSLILFGLGSVMGYDQGILLTVSIALLSVIMFASLFGTLIPLVLDRFKIDPAVATGPFITTSNDVISLFIYFYIGRLIIGV